LLMTKGKSGHTLERLPHPGVLRFCSIPGCGMISTVKNARAEVAESTKDDLAKLRNAVLAAERLAAYEVLVRGSDLTNPELAKDERVRRAERLLRTYDCLLKVKPDFRDKDGQLTAARRIHMAAYRERKRTKFGAGAPVRGRPRKLHI
jgi:hypothetical protein